MDTMYCFVDESGQDTKGRIFVVAVVIAGKDEKDALETQLQEIERKTGKGLKKWHRSSREKRRAYLEAVVSIQSLKESVFCFVFETTKAYGACTSESVVRAIRSRAVSVAVIVVIDGLNGVERASVKRVLRARGIHYKKVVGTRDESSAPVRLADAVAGCVRDSEEGAVYAQEIIAKFIHRRVLMKNSGN